MDWKKNKKNKKTIRLDEGKKIQLSRSLNERRLIRNPETDHWEKDRWKNGDWQTLKLMAQRQATRDGVHICGAVPINGLWSWNGIAGSLTSATEMAHEKETICIFFEHCFAGEEEFPAQSLFSAWSVRTQQSSATEQLNSKVKFSSPQHAGWERLYSVSFSWKTVDNSAGIEFFTSRRTEREKKRLDFRTIRVLHQTGGGQDTGVERWASIGSFY